MILVRCLLQSSSDVGHPLHVEDTKTVREMRAYLFVSLSFLITALMFPIVYSIALTSGLLGAEYITGRPRVFK